MLPAPSEMAVAGFRADQDMGTSTAFSLADQVHASSLYLGAQVFAPILSHRNSKLRTDGVGAEPDKLRAKFAAAVQSFRGNGPVNRVGRRGAAASQQEIGGMLSQPREGGACRRQRAMRRAQFRQDLR